MISKLIVFCVLVEISIGEPSQRDITGKVYCNANPAKGVTVYYYRPRDTNVVLGAVWDPKENATVGEDGIFTITVSDYKKNSFVRIPHRCMEKPWPNCNAVAHVNVREAVTEASTTLDPTTQTASTLGSIFPGQNPTTVAPPPTTTGAPGVSTEIDMGRLDLDNLRNIEWECKDGKKYPQLLR